MNKVLLIIIDGCRSESLRKTNTPHIDRLISSGSYTFSTETVRPSITLPTCIDLIASTTSCKSTLNKSTPEENLSTAWSLIDLVRNNGRETAAFYSWELLRKLSHPDLWNMSTQINRSIDADSELKIAAAAAVHLKTCTPDFCLVYLEQTDFTGQKFGFMSNAHLKAIEDADQAVGILMKEMDQLAPENRPHIVLHCDQGGTGRHQENLSVGMQVPWIAAGPKIRQNHLIKEPVSVLDTAPTITRLMGIRPHRLWLGKALDIFSEVAERSNEVAQMMNRMTAQSKAHAETLNDAKKTIVEIKESIQNNAHSALALDQVIAEFRIRDEAADKEYLPMSTNTDLLPRPIKIAGTIGHKACQGIV